MPLLDPVGDALNSFVGSAIDSAMKGIWSGVLSLLRGAFELVDSFSAFTLSFNDRGNPVDPSLAAVWGVLRPLAGSVALGLFFWQLVSMMLRGGRGFWRSATGPFAYGIALVATGGVVALVLGAADEVTTLLLEAGLRVGTFGAVLDHEGFAQQQAGGDGALLHGASAVTLGLVGLFGVLPAALGYLLEMIFRQAAILVLVATIPITAAGLVAQTTASWFWRTLRWIIAAIVMKPALALVLVAGVSVMKAPQGLAGLLAGVGVLLIALFSPLAVFRLFSFVEPGTNYGAAARSWWSSSSSSSAGGGGEVNTSSGTAAAEAANTSRFDQAMAGIGGVIGAGAGFVGAAAGAATDYGNAQMDATGVGWRGGGGNSSGGNRGAQQRDTGGEDNTDTTTNDGGGAGGGDSGPTVTNVNVFGSGGSGGSAPDPPGHDSGGGRSRPAGGGGAAAGGADETAGAAVVL